MAKSPDAFRTISEVADWLDTPAHVLRFWESRFTQVKPVKRAGGRRYYRPNDMLLLGGIKKLLHDDGMTIKGAQKMLRTEGVKKIAALSQPIDGGEKATDDADMIDVTPKEKIEEPAPIEITPSEQPQAATPDEAPATPVEADLFAEPEAPATPEPEKPKEDTPPVEVAPEPEPVVPTAPAPADTTQTDPKPKAVAASGPSADQPADSDKKAALTAIYTRLSALHDRMKAAADNKQQG